MKDLFEGVYLKHQKNGESICFIAGRAGETRFVQVITNGTVRQYDGAQGFCFGEEGVAAELPGVQGALRYGPLSPLRTDIMGPFRFLPMQCSHSVYSMAHTLAGGFTVDGRFIDLTGGTGYIEGDRGSAFPRDYLWVQCNDFAQPCSVMASVAHIPFCGRSFTGCICAVVYAAVNTGWPPTGACASWRRRPAGLCCGRAGICWKRPSRRGRHIRCARPEQTV